MTFTLGSGAAGPRRVFFSVFIRKSTWLLAVLSAIFTSGCSYYLHAPEQTNSICGVLENREEWGDAVYAASNKWNIAEEVILAILFQESSFDAHALPEREKLLGFIPWFRPSSAKGYAQALDSTWEDYKRATGKTFAFRLSFVDAADFVGWYCNKSAILLDIRRNDAYRLYLAYHEGWEGYRRGNYRQKPKLLASSKRVQTQAEKYATQLRKCRLDADKGWFW